MPASVRGRQGWGQGDSRHPHAATVDERDAREGRREARGGQPETKAPPERGWRARTTISKQYPLPRLRLRSLREDAVNSAPGDLVFPHELPDGHVLAVPHDVHAHDRSEEHTSELQSPDHLVCRLLLEKKKIQSKSAYVS